MPTNIYEHIPARFRSSIAFNLSDADRRIEACPLSLLVERGNEVNDGSGGDGRAVETHALERVAGLPDNPACWITEAAIAATLPTVAVGTCYGAGRHILDLPTGGTDRAASHQRRLYREGADSARGWPIAVIIGAAPLANRGQCARTTFMQVAV